MILQFVDGGQIPEFDNLYLDMNSILHTCTHSNDDTLTRMTDDQMYAAIFAYIEHLFEIIKPQQVFYMAIDGVAPRAKMNQQRARRFRTAYEAEENLKKAIAAGETIPKDDPFDSNSITPGTEFMAKLTDNLKYFVHKKISEDARWARIQVVLSGHEVPGEGEHKIMEYIRTIKSQKDYNGNLRHCIYGLDADLIMLGLVSHDPHFALLREEVTFGPRAGKSLGDVNDQRFYLLHLSLLREYLTLEFQDLEFDLPFEYSFERILDDFILIMYVIGNDFLPNLPDLFINKGAFPLLIETFKQSLRNVDGYINEGGRINFRRLNVFLTYLSEFELENFERNDVDIDWFNKKLEDISITGERKRERMGKLLLLKDQKKLVSLISPWLLDVASHKYEDLVKLDAAGELLLQELPTDEVTQHLDFIRTFAMEAGLIIVHSKSSDKYEARLDIDGISPYETDDEFQERRNDLARTLFKYELANLFETDEIMKETKDIYDQKFLNWKDKYYKEKLHFSIYDDDEMIKLTQHYIEGLQWVLYYYYKGCPSWNWYFKYHYAPRISDISRGLNAFINNNQYAIEFDKSHPFKPFEQLMAVLPARSRKLMPAVYRPLMVEQHSPIIDFYPHEVDIDLNGKTASWEAVVLLSFVNEQKLIDTLKPIEEKLTPEETRRNSFGRDIHFVFNAQTDYVYLSPLPGFFKDIEHDKVHEQQFSLPAFDPEYNLALGTQVKLGKEALAGFPTLKSIPFESELRLNEVKVFQHPSRSESMILTVEDVWDETDVASFAEKHMGKIVYTKWPFLRESRVVAVETREFRYESVKSGTTRKFISSSLEMGETKDYNKAVSQFSSEYAKTKGVEIGPVKVLVHVQPVTGLIRNARGAYVKTFSKNTEYYPLQLVVELVKNKDKRFATRGPVPVEKEFPVDSQVVFLGAFAYGTPAVVVGHQDHDKLNIKVNKIQSALEPNIGKKRVIIENKEIRYLASYEVSKQLRLNPLFLLKITSGFMVDDGGKRLNIGLELKFEGRRQKVLGFTRKPGKFWEYSPLAVQLLRDYQGKYPQLFKKLTALGDQKAVPKVNAISSETEIRDVRRWLKEVKSQLVTVSLESEALTKFSLTAIEDYMDHYISQPIPLTNKDIKGVPNDAILHPSESLQLLSSQKFDLGDRVIFIQDSGKVPRLSKGTVVGITASDSKNELSVVFDHPQLSAGNMNGKLRSNRGLIVESSTVLNLTNKQLVYHSKASKDRKPITDEERELRAQRAELARRKKQEQEQARDKQIDQKKSNELLNILKKKPEAANGETEEAPGTGGSDEEARSARNANAIKQIYGQIYSNVMNEGAPQGPPVPPGVTIPPHLYGGNAPPAPYGIPVVPEIPLPPQYFQNRYPEGTQAAGSGPQDTQQPQNGEQRESSRGRGRGGFRGNFRGRGGARGGVRGRGRGNQGQGGN